MSADSPYSAGPQKGRQRHKMQRKKSDKEGRAIDQSHHLTSPPSPVTSWFNFGVGQPAESWARWQWVVLCRDRPLTGRGLRVRGASPSAAPSNTALPGTLCSCSCSAQCAASGAAGPCSLRWRVRECSSASSRAKVQAASCHQHFSNPFLTSNLAGGRGRCCSAQSAQHCPICTRAQHL